MNKKSFSHVVLLAIICLPMSAWAENGKLRWESFTAAAFNPLGLVELAMVTYRKPLYKSESPLFATNFVEASILGASTPAYGFVGLQAQLQPLSILRLRARAEAIGFYGNFGHIARFDSVNADYSDTELDKISDAGENSSALGVRLTFSSLFQVAVKQVAVRSHLQATHVDLDLEDNERFYYSPQFDYLVEDGGWFVQNDLDLVWLFPSGLVAGVRMNSSWAVYSDDVADEDPNGPSHRIGPLVAWPFFEGEGRIQRATAIGLANWYVKNRFRAGQDVSQAIPYVAVALQLEGDL